MVREFADYSKEERVMQLGKDYANEFEDVGINNNINDIHAPKPEEVLTIQQQVKNLMKNNKMDARQRFFRNLYGDMMPLERDHFGKKEIVNASTRATEWWKRLKRPFGDAPISILRQIERIDKVNEISLQKFYDHLDQVQKELNLPLDELYQKEKSLVLKVVEAENRLTQKLSL